MSRRFNSNDTRRAQLAKIHIAAEELGMDTKDQNPDSEYRSMLWSLGRVRSAGDLDEAGRKAVLDHLKAVGFRGKNPANRHHEGAPHNIDSPDRGPMLRKIEAYLAEAKRPWSYVDAMAQRMFHVDRVALCSPEQLRKIIAALDYDARRSGRYTGQKGSRAKGT